LTNLTTHTSVISKYSIKNTNKEKLELSYEIPMAIFLMLITEDLYFIFIPNKVKDEMTAAALISVTFRRKSLNFSLADRVLIYMIRIITPPKNTKTIK